MHPAIRSLPGVCTVEIVRGAAAAADTRPDLLLEVPHGATRGHHFTELRARLDSDIRADLIEFFFTNTDVGAPELARAIAASVVAERPERAALVIRSEIPRTLVDCNRRLDPNALPSGSEPGQMTPGLPPWIRSVADQRLLLELHASYREVAAAAFEFVCAEGQPGHGLMVHTYAPRSLDVAVDENIVTALREAYDRPTDWPLRAEIDLITHDPDGRELADPALTARVEQELASVGRQVERNGVYSLHPASLAHEFADRHPGRTLCFEVRRDLLVSEFLPFVELAVDPARVAELAAPIAIALV